MTFAVCGCASATQVEIRSVIGGLLCKLYFHFGIFKVPFRICSNDDFRLSEQATESGPSGLGGAGSKAGHSRPIFDVGPEVVPRKTFVCKCEVEQSDFLVSGKLLPGDK